MKPGVTEVLGMHVKNPPTSGHGGMTIATGWCEKCQRVIAINKESCDCGQRAVIREWPVSPLEDRIKGQFETEVRRRARMAYTTLQREDPVESAELRSQYSVDFTDGKYNWEDYLNEKNYIREARMKSWGAIYLMYLMLHRCDPKVTEERALEIWLANHTDSLAAYSWALGLVGNSPTPAVSGAAGVTSESGSIQQTSQTEQKTFDD